MLPLFPDSRLVRGEFDLAKCLLEIDPCQGWKELLFVLFGVLDALDAVQEVADGIGVGHWGVLVLGDLLLGQEDSAGDELLLGLELVVLLLGDLGFGVK